MLVVASHTYSCIIDVEQERKNQSLGLPIGHACVYSRIWRRHNGGFDPTHCDLYLYLLYSSCCTNTVEKKGCDLL